MQLSERNIHVGCCLFSHKQNKKQQTQKQCLLLRHFLREFVVTIYINFAEKIVNLILLLKMLDQLAIYKGENNDKWFEKQRKMISKSCHK